MDDLKQSVQTVYLEQKDPLVIYKVEAYNLFKRMSSDVNREIVSFLCHASLPVQADDHQQLREGRGADAASQDIAGAVQWLGSGGAKVGVTGFCMGGALTLLAACLVPDIDAAVTWYGFPPLEYIDASKIKAPLLGHWATQDQAFAIADVDTLEAKLKEAGVSFEFHRYLAQHGFANETAIGLGRIPMTQYDPAWAQQAWDRSLRFFGRVLG